MLTVAVLTGLRPGLLERTLDSFVAHHQALWSSARRVVVHNTGDPATAKVLDRYRWHERETTDRLLPIGEATALLNSLCEGDITLRLEDDWQAHPVPIPLDLLDDADQVRLRRTSDAVAPRCAVCRRRTAWERLDGGHLVGHTHWTYNPTLTRTAALVAGPERDAMRATHPATVVQHVPGVFSHIGDESLRANGGAA